MNFYQHQADDFDKQVRVNKLPIVYVLASHDLKYIKVGKTKSPKQRFINIQSGCPFTLFLWLAIKTPKESHIEKYIHFRLSHCRVRGEWFEPSEDDLDDLSNFFKQTNANVREVFNALL